MAQQIGLKAVLDMTQFNAGVKEFISGVNKMNDSTRKVASTTKSEGGGILSVLSSIGLSWSRVASIFTGVTLAGVFRDISRGLKEVASDAISAVTTFQELNIQFTTLLARDFTKQFGGNIADNLAKVSGQAKELLTWIRQIAVTTPFSPESIAEAIAYGQAFGFTIAQSKRMALATGEFTSGMGLSDEVMKRIIYNFGQMLASGRVLGRELRDLANNFVPVRDITQDLADKAGVSFDQMKADMAAGKVSAQAFIESFVQMAERDFPGAMERMSKTLQGVQQNIKDFIHTVLGLELLGPVGAKIGEILSVALTEAFNPKLIKTFTAIGFAIRGSFDIIFQALRQNLVPAIHDFLAALGFIQPTGLTVATTMTKIALGIRLFIDTLAAGIRAITSFINLVKSKIGQGLSSISKNAGEWGSNIIIAFANGMAQAISYVIKIITQVASAIASLLRGHSPPKILPDLEKWGKAAMKAWLKGWGSADFEVFNDIAGEITGFLKSLGDKIPETQLIPRIMGTRAAISEAINAIRSTGEVTSSAINKIMKAAKLSGKEFKTFITSIFDLEKATHTLEGIKGVLDFDPSVGFGKVFNRVITGLGDLQAAANQFTGQVGDAVKIYVRDLIDLAEAEDVAKKAQDDLNTVTKHYDTILASLEAQQNKLNDDIENSTILKKIDAALASGLLTDEERTRILLEKRGILLKRAIRDTEHDKKVSVDAANDKIEAAKAAQEAIEASLARQKQLTLDLAQTQADAAKERFDAAKAFIDAEIENNNLIQQQIDLLERLAKQAAGAGGIDTPTTDFSGISDAAGKALEDASAEIEASIKTLQDRMIIKFGAMMSNIKAPFRDLAKEIPGLITSIGDAFTSFKENPNVIAFKTSWDTFIIDLELAWLNLGVFWDANGPGIVDKAGKFVKGLVEAMGIDLTKVKVDPTVLLKGLGDILTSIGTSIDTLTTSLVNNGPKIQDNLQKLFDFMTTGTKNLIDFLGLTLAIGSSVKDTLAPAFDELGKSLDGLKKPIDDLLVDSGLLAEFNKANEEFSRGFLFIVAGILTLAIAILVGLIDGVVKGLSNMAQGAKDFSASIKITIGDVKQFFTDVKDTITDLLTGNWEEWKKDWSKGWEDLKKIPNDIMTDIGNFIETQLGLAMGFFSGFVDGVKGFFNNLYDELIRQSIIPDMLTDMTTAFTTWFEDTLKALEQWLKDTLDALKKKVPEFIKAGISLMAGLLVGMISMVFGKNGLIAQAASWMSSTIASMLTKLGEFVIAGATLLTGFVTGAYAAITDPKTGLMARVKGAIASAATAIIHAPDIIASWVLIGENIILGLITGIQNKVMDLIKAIKNALTAALDAAAEKLKLGSPSKVWFEVGTQMMRGLESGIRSGISGVKDAVSNIPTPAGLGSGKLAFSTNVSQNVNSFMNSRGFNIPVGSGGTTIINNIDRSNTIEVNPTYKNFQSEARIYHDITAALAVTRR